VIGKIVVVDIDFVESEVVDIAVDTEVADIDVIVVGIVV